MVLASSFQLAILAVLASAAPSTSASPMHEERQGASTSKQAHRFNLAKRSRSFADANGMFDVAAFQQEKEMVAHKYAHSNARYRRNLDQGMVNPPSRRRSEPAPVYDVAKREYMHHSHSKRQSSSSGGTTGAVELTDCEFAPNSQTRGLAAGREPQKTKTIG